MLTLPSTVYKFADRTLDFDFSMQHKNNSHFPHVLWICYHANKNCYFRESNLRTEIDLILTIAF